MANEGQNKGQVKEARKLWKKHYPPGTIDKPYHLRCLTDRFGVFGNLLVYLGAIHFFFGILCFLGFFMTDTDPHVDVLFIFSGAFLIISGVVTEVYDNVIEMKRWRRARARMANERPDLLRILLESC